MKNLFWIDLEMTGLDVEKEVIIEAAAIVTDFDFKILDQYHAVVKQEQKYLDSMDDWNKKHHGESGLTEKVLHGTDVVKVEKDLCAMIDKHFVKDRPMLAGNSISQDRLFIDKYLKTLPRNCTTAFSTSVHGKSFLMKNTILNTRRRTRTARSKIFKQASRSCSFI